MHDAIEDQEVSADKIQERFGPDVAALVQEVSLGEITSGGLVI